jgi:transcription-repair coupling factor (superfamily II helicase)
MTTLSRLARTRASQERPRILCTTVNALVQRTPPRSFMESASFSAAPGNALEHERSGALAGDQRLPALHDRARRGEYAVRGGILDLHRPGMNGPVRLDFFGDTLESIRVLRSGDPAHDSADCVRSISCR